jgi:hypothetical protein
LRYWQRAFYIVGPDPEASIYFSGPSPDGLLPVSDPLFGFLSRNRVFVLDLAN